ncbi:MAG: hypothetical protein JJU40_07240 [Rhodobacteraceae bacterium]|nr:hypothetical protein [Paracoccaceae bacterium]
MFVPPARAVMVLVLSVVLSACSLPSPADRAAQAWPESTQWHVTDVRVTVPEALSVSEENAFFPDADIVWRCSPGGDRHAQITALMERALRQGAAHLDGPEPVRLEAVVSRFHGVSQRTRYTFGGVHDIRFALSVHSARTGAPLGPEIAVHTRLRALSGARAIEADARGETQTARVTRHVAAVVAGHLGAEVAPLPRPPAPQACTAP